MSKEVTIEELDSTLNKQTPTELAKSALNKVYNEEAVKLSGDYIELARSKMEWRKTLYSNLAMIQGRLFNPTNFPTLTNKELLFAMAMHLKAVSALEVSVTEHKENIKEIFDQIQLLFSSDNNILKIPKESRDKIRTSVTKAIKDLINAADIKDDSLIDMLEPKPTKQEETGSAILDNVNKLNEQNSKTKDFSIITALKTPEYDNKTKEDRFSPFTKYQDDAKKEFEAIKNDKKDKPE